MDDSNLDDSNLDDSNLDDSNLDDSAMAGEIEVKGEVIRVGVGDFVVACKINDRQILVRAYTSMHLKRNKIRVVLHDRVNILVSAVHPPGEVLGRIISRH